jgi:hypothetical protein
MTPVGGFEQTLGSSARIFSRFRSSTDGAVCERTIMQIRPILVAFVFITSVPVLSDQSATGTQRPPQPANCESWVLWTNNVACCEPKDVATWTITSAHPDFNSCLTARQERIASTLKGRPGWGVFFDDQILGPRAPDGTMVVGALNFRLVCLPASVSDPRSKREQ